MSDRFKYFGFYCWLFMWLAFMRCRMFNSWMEV